MPRRDGGMWFSASLGPVVCSAWSHYMSHRSRVRQTVQAWWQQRCGRDAEAIVIAARQPTMRFVAIKSVEQQAILAWHSVPAGWQEERTALLNRTRGLLAEFGVVIARSADRLLAALPGLVEDARLPTRCAPCCWKCVSS
jgi:hypothetical protein